MAANSDISIKLVKGKGLDTITYNLKEKTLSEGMTQAVITYESNITPYIGNVDWIKGYILDYSKSFEAALQKCLLKSSILEKALNDDRFNEQETELLKKSYKKSIAKVKNEFEVIYQFSTRINEYDTLIKAGRLANSCNFKNLAIKAFQAVPKEKKEFNQVTFELLSMVRVNILKLTRVDDCIRFKEVEPDEKIDKKEQAALLLWLAKDCESKDEFGRDAQRIAIQALSDACGIPIGKRKSFELTPGFDMVNSLVMFATHLAEEAATTTQKTTKLNIS